MSSYAPPVENFTGIQYNSAFFQDPNASITAEYANRTFLKRVGNPISIAGSTTFRGDIIPGTDATYNLGSSTVAFNNIYAVTGHFDNTIVSTSETQNQPLYTVNATPTTTTLNNGLIAGRGVQTAAITATSCTSNVVTIVTATTPAVGSTVAIFGLVTHYELNELEFVVATATLNVSFTVAYTRANYASVADTGSWMRMTFGGLLWDKTTGYTKLTDALVTAPVASTALGQATGVLEVGRVQFDGSSSGSTSIKASATPTAYTITLPPAVATQAGSLMVSTTGGALSNTNSNAYIDGSGNATLAGTLACSTSLNVTGSTIATVTLTDTGAGNTGTITLDGITMGFNPQLGNVMELTPTLVSVNASLNSGSLSVTGNASITSAAPTLTFNDTTASGSTTLVYDDNTQILTLDHGFTTEGILTVKSSAPFLVMHDTGASNAAIMSYVGATGKVSLDRELVCTGGLTSTGTTAVNLSTDASATTVSIATGGAVKAVTIGSTTAGSTTNIKGGTSGVGITIGSVTGILKATSGLLSTSAASLNDLSDAGVFGSSLYVGDKSPAVNYNGNTFVGINSVGASITALGNYTVVGSGSCTALVSGNYGVVVGDGSANALTTGAGNTVIGSTSMVGTLSAGIYNSSVGNATSMTVGDWSYTSILGASSTVTGSHAIALGYSATAPANKMVIGDASGYITGVNPGSNGNTDLGADSFRWKNLYVNGVGNFKGTTDSTSISTGSIVTAGGIGCAKNLRALQLSATGDSGGTASQTALTNATVAGSTAVNVIAGSTAGTPQTSAGYLKMYLGTTAVYVPYFTTT
jgi:hypothetical protein